MDASRRTRAVAALTTAALTLAGTLVAASPAHAVSLDVGTGAELQAAIATANATAGHDTIVITADITDADLLLEVTGALTIVVGGHTVSSVRLRATADLTLTGPGTWTAGTPTLADVTAAPGLGISVGNTLTIEDLTVTAVGTTCDAGIGGWNVSGVNSCASWDAVQAGAIEITNSAVTASGGRTAAGVGGGYVSSGGTVTIKGSFVAATGGEHAAGIGGGEARSGDDIDITGSTVHATGGTNAAGIGGGGLGGAGGTIRIADSTITSTGGQSGAGIGGGNTGAGGAVTLIGSTVSATGNVAPGIGPGRGASTPPPPGTLSLTSSTLVDTRASSITTVESGTIVTAKGTVTLDGPTTNNGTIVIVDTDAAGALAGTGAIVNNGTIRPAANVLATDVSVHHYTVTYDHNHPGAPDAPVNKVYAPTFDNAQQALPTPTRDGFVLAAWNTAADGSGDDVTPSTPLAPLGPTPTLFARWAEPSISVAPSTPSVTAGETTTFTTSLAGVLGASTDVSADAVLTSTDDSDEISGTGIRFTSAGPRTITSTYDGLTATATVTVTPGAVVAHTDVVTASTPTSITHELRAVDAFGNVVGPASTESPVFVNPGPGSSFSINPALGVTTVMLTAPSSGLSRADVIGYGITTQVTAALFSLTFDLNHAGAPAPTTLSGFAASLDQLGLTPPGTDRDGFFFRGWNTAADGTGDAFDPAAAFTDMITTTLYAQWQADLPTLTASATTVTAGDEVQFTTTRPLPEGGSSEVPATYTSTNDEDDVTGSTIRFTTQGTRTITAHAGGDTATIDITVVPGPLASLHVVPPSATVDLGASVTFTVTGADAYGNAVDPGTVTVESSAIADAVDGTRVSFRTVGPRTLTIASGRFTASVDVVVNPVFTVTWDENHPDAATTVTTVEGVSPADAGIDLLAPEWAGHVIAGWNTAPDGTGTALTADTLLAEIADVQHLTVYAQWEARTLTLAPADATVTAGSTQVFTATANGPFGSTVDASADVAVTSDEPTDLILGHIVQVVQSGPRTITAAFDGATATAVLTVEPDALAELAIDLSATSVPQGGSVTLTVTGTDAYGNPVEIDPADVTVTSSVPTDVVDGLTVTFPHASPHVLTATVGEVSATVTVEVVPAPAPAAALPPTGADAPWTTLAIAALLLLLGIGFRARTRRIG